MGLYQGCHGFHSGACAMRQIVCSSYVLKLATGAVVSVVIA